MLQIKENQIILAPIDVSLAHNDEYREVSDAESSTGKRVLTKTLDVLCWQPRVWRGLAWATLLLNYLTCSSSLLTKDAFFPALNGHRQALFYQIFADARGNFPLHTLVIALAFGSLFFSSRWQNMEKANKKSQRLECRAIHSDMRIRVCRAASTLVCISVALFSICSLLLTHDPRSALTEFDQTTSRISSFDRDPVSFWILLAGFMVDWYTCSSQLREKYEVAVVKAAKDQAEKVSRALEEGNLKWEDRSIRADLETFHELDSSVTNNDMKCALFKMWPIQCLTAIMLTLPSLKFSGYSDSLMHTHPLVRYTHVGYIVCLVLAYSCSIGYMTMHAMDEKLKELKLPRLTPRERRVFSPLFFSRCLNALFVFEGYLLIAIRYNLYLPHVPAIPAFVTPILLVGAGGLSMAILGAGCDLGAREYARRRGVYLES